MKSFCVVVVVVMLVLAIGYVELIGYLNNPNFGRGEDNHTYGFYGGNDEQTLKSAWYNCQGLNIDTQVRNHASDSARIYARYCQSN